MGDSGRGGQGMNSEETRVTTIQGMKEKDKNRKQLS